jgi:hypothetical protein
LHHGSESIPSFGTRAPRTTGYPGVIAGSNPLKSAEAVATAEDDHDSTVPNGVVELIASSAWHRLDVDGEPRFRMLETIREHALD